MYDIDRVIMNGTVAEAVVDGTQKLRIESEEYERHGNGFDAFIVGFTVNHGQKRLVALTFVLSSHRARRFRGQKGTDKQRTNLGD